MPAYDPQRDRARPTPGQDAVIPVDALLDGIATPPVDPEPAEPVEMSPVDEPKSDVAPVIPITAATRPPIDPDSESPQRIDAPRVTPLPVDPEDDRALAKLGVLGAAVTFATLFTFWRQLRKRRR